MWLLVLGICEDVHIMGPLRPMKTVHCPTRGWVRFAESSTSVIAYGVLRRPKGRRREPDEREHGSGPGGSAPGPPWFRVGREPTSDPTGPFGVPSESDQKLGDGPLT